MLTGLPPASLTTKTYQDATLPRSTKPGPITSTAFSPVPHGWRFTIRTADKRSVNSRFRALDSGLYDAPETVQRFDERLASRCLFYG